MTRYAFYDGGIPSFDEVSTRIKNDAGLQSDARQALIVDLDMLVLSVRKLQRFVGLDATTLPFTRDIVKGLLKQAEPIMPARMHKRLAVSCQTVLRHYGLAHPPQWAALTGAIASLAAQLPNDYRTRHVTRLISFAETANIDLHHLDQASMEAFRAALMGDPSVKWPDRVWKSCAYAWNNLVDDIPGWPQQPVTIGPARPVKGLSWTALPASFRKQAETVVKSTFTYLAPGSLGAKRAGRKPRTEAAILLYLRLAATALVEAGVVTATEITDVRTLFAGDHFPVIADGFIASAGGQSPASCAPKS